MDSVFWTLMIVLIAGGVDGIKVLVSIPEGELTEAIKNATKQETKILERELKSMKNQLQSIKALLKQSSGSALMIEEKPNVDPTLEPTPEPTSEPDSTPEPEPEPEREPRLIEITNGEAKWNSLPNKGFPVERAFSTEGDYKNHYGCSGRTGRIGEYYYYQQPFPHMIWYKFPSAHTPVKFSFQRTHTFLSPKTYIFVGSSDENCDQNSSWFELCGDKIGKKKTVKGEYVGCDVPRLARAPFRCLGIKIFSKNGGSNESERNAVCIRAMRFWE